MGMQFDFADLGEAPEAFMGVQFDFAYLESILTGLGLQ